MSRPLWKTGRRGCFPASTPRRRPDPRPGYLGNRAVGAAFLLLRPAPPPRLSGKRGGGSYFPAPTPRRRPADLGNGAVGATFTLLRPAPALPPAPPIWETGWRGPLSRSYAPPPPRLSGKRGGWGCFYASTPRPPPHPKTTGIYGQLYHRIYSKFYHNMPKHDSH